jgi:hypothetical protein
MGRAKEIIVKVIPSKLANEFVKQHHYSGKVVNNSSLHFGCFLDDKLHGVLSYGSPLDKRKVLPLVQPSLWNEMLELNRMAFDEYLPKYSESRCIAISIRLIRKNAPHIKWILSFSDGTQCGDGTIYRASGFYLTGIRESKNDLWQLPDKLKFLSSGDVIHRMTIQTDGAIINKWALNEYKGSVPSLNKIQEKHGGRLLSGFQLRYIYLIDKSCKITVPILPFSMIDKMGAGMYKGEKITLAERQQAQEVNQDKRDASSIEIGGSIPTLALNLQAKNRQHG